ncbi:MAG: hypothetical protein M3O71_29235 [Bacteroidota bacterium]|nr:hypothetical protein [Bacteroidota bacterium]
MTAQELINLYRNSPDEKTVKSVLPYFRFEPVMQGKSVTDLNLEFRIEIVNGLLNDFSLLDIELIRSLFTEDVICDRATFTNADLYQQCFYLFSLGQLEDTFILYDAKYNATNMDTGMMLDREAMTLGHEIEKVIDYVESRFESEPALAGKYPDMLADLKDLQLNPDYENIGTYTQFIKGYFFGREKI